MHTMNAAQFTALKELMRDWNNFIGDEKCDHSVNICYCDMYQNMETLNKFVQGEES